MHRHPLDPPARSLLLCALPALLLALPSAPAAQAIHAVPGDFASIQQAIDASSPGDVVVILGGTHEGPITLDRPLTLLGEPRPTIQPPFATGGLQPPAIRLAGSGAGRVVLSNLEVSGFVNGLSTAASSAGIQGGGFDELHLVDCAVEGPTWVLLSGQAFGAPALRTDVADVLLERSTLRGADSANDGCYGNGPPGPAGVEAPDSRLLVLDSVVRGGGSHSICGFGSCPIGGAGGPGIVAARLSEAASDVQGGEGALHFTDAGGESCGSAPDGAASVVDVHSVLGGVLRATSTPRLGRSWRVSWSTPGSSSVLIVGTQILLPPLQTPAGLLFVHPSSRLLARGFPAGSASFDLRIPLDASLLGRELVAQVRGSAGWTRPLLALVRSERIREQRNP
jgi:hypothetical protein